MAPFAHTAPAEVKMASLAAHVRTPSVFFDSNAALGTPSHVSGQCKARKGNLLLIIALSALVPRLLALEASEVTAVQALNLFVSFLNPRDVLLTLQVRAPDHISVLIDLTRQP